MRKSTKKNKSVKKKEKPKTGGIAISGKNQELNSRNFLNIHWELAHALLNNTVNPAVANAFASQTARILGYKKLELEKARLMGEKPLTLLGK